MAKQTIILKGTGIRKERIAAGTITPGMLVEIDSNDLVAFHSVAGGNARKLFAVEDDLQGNGIADDYLVDVQVQFNAMHAGEEVYAFLDVLENVVIGDALESAGNGRLREYQPIIIEGSPAEVAQDNQIVAYALEAKDLSTTGDAAARLDVEIA